MSSIRHSCIIFLLAGLLLLMGLISYNFINYFTMQSQLSNSSKNPSRPKSAITYRTPHQKQHRIDDNQSLNNIKNQICKVFQQQKKPLKEIKDLTAKVDPTYAHRINRMCVQYSICTNPKRQKRLSEDIDVQFIAKYYIKAKSKDKKKEDERNELIRSIAQTSKRHIPAQQQSFFKFDHQSLRKMELNASKNNKHLKEHPYITLYQKSQMQAMTNLTERNSFNLDELTKLPAFAEPDEWEKESKAVKLIYRGIKKLRSNTQRYAQKKRENQDSFYIT